MYCKHLWNNLVLAPDGKYKSCCHMHSVGTYVVGDHLDQLFMHSKLEAVRQEMAAGVWHPACGTCKRMEDVGVISLRQRLGDGNEDDIPVLRSVDIRTNACNLGCHICGPKNSSTLIPITIEMRQRLDMSMDKAVLKGLAITPNIKKELLEQVQNKVMEGSLTTINLIGGEPLLDPNTWDLIQFVIDNKIKHVRFHMITNLMVPTPTLVKFIEMCEQLLVVGSRIGFKVSCDGYGSAVEFGRDKFSWALFESNMNVMTRLAAQCNIVIGYVLTIPSIDSLPQFIQWMKDVVHPRIKLVPSLYHPHGPNDIPSFGSANLYLNDISYFTDEQMGGIVATAIKALIDCSHITDEQRINATTILAKVVGSKAHEFVMEPWRSITKTRYALNETTQWLQEYVERAPFFKCLVE